MKIRITVYVALGILVSIGLYCEYTIISKPVKCSHYYLNNSTETIIIFNMYKSKKTKNDFVLKPREEILISKEIIDILEWKFRPMKLRLHKYTYYVSYY